MITKIPWPTLFIESSFGCFNSPSSPKAFSEIQHTTTVTEFETDYVNKEVKTEERFRDYRIYLQRRRRFFQRSQRSSYRSFASAEEAISNTIRSSNLVN